MQNLREKVEGRKGDRSKQMREEGRPLDTMTHFEKLTDIDIGSVLVFWCLKHMQSSPPQPSLRIRMKISFSFSLTRKDKRCSSLRLSPDWARQPNFAVVPN